MAYPFEQAPRFSDFLERLKKVGVELKETKGALADNQQKVAYLYRSIESEPFYYPLSFASDDERVQWTVVRAVCAALKVDPVIFGLSLEPSPDAGLAE